MTRRPRLLLVNQFIGPLFSDVIESARSYYDVTVFKSIRYSRSPVLFRIFTWLFFFVHLTFFLLCRRNHFDKILFVSNPLLLLFDVAIGRIFGLNSDL